MCPYHTTRPGCKFLYILSSENNTCTIAKFMFKLRCSFYISHLTSPFSLLSSPTLSQPQWLISHETWLSIFNECHLKLIDKKTRNGNDETKPETCAYANAGGRDRGIARDYEIDLYLQLAVSGKGYRHGKPLGHTLKLRSNNSLS